MSSASLSPADFASPVGFLGPLVSTPYYPTGDLQRDRAVAFTTAMDYLDHMEDHLHGNDGVRIATTLFELAQALSDLGLHKYALDTSGFALDTLEHPYVATPNGFHRHVASILSLRANILCDLKQNDEAIDAANRAVTLYKEFQGSQTTAVPELTFALLNSAVLLSSIGLKEKGAGVALQLLSEVDEDMKVVSALCNLCLSNVRFDAEDGTDLSMTEEAIKITHESSGLISQTALAGALLNKSKILSSGGQNEAAIPFSAEAVTLLRDMSATQPVFSLFLAHALDNHAHHLSEANHKNESYSIRQDAVELWQALKVSAPNAIARSLAWSLFELAKFRCKGGDRNVLRGELGIAQHTVEVFREVVPLDVPGLADALYLFADRMLELDNNRDAATYAEESAQHFREAYEKDRKYALDLIFSLSLASSCLACTERSKDALHYAKQAVEVQRERNGVEDKTYNSHLCWLLMQVMFRSTEMNKQEEGIPFFQELQALDTSGGTHRFPRFDQRNG
jgi:tetratricopeptide (TPR) repeat protein